MNTDRDAPNAWDDLIEGLTLLSSHPTSTSSPLHCEHDTLYVQADPDAFTPEQLKLLEHYGFVPGEDGTFYSFRFGSA